MSSDEVTPIEELDSALLLISREPVALTDLLRHGLPGEVLDTLQRKVRRRKPGRVGAAAQLADAVVQDQKLRRAVATSLWQHLAPSNGTALPSDESLNGPDVEQVADPLRRAALRAALGCDDPQRWEMALQWLQAWHSWLPDYPPTEAPPSGRSASRKTSPTKRTAARRGRPTVPVDKSDQLDAARTEIARLEQNLALERQRKEALQHRLDEARSDALLAEQRAAEVKQQLRDVTEASDREAALGTEVENLRRRCSVLEQKLALLEEERDDLRGVLEDYDHFFLTTEEEVPSFRDRPLTSPEQDLVGQLAARNGSPFRILVVGGGEPQHRHRDKLVEYAEVVGFTSDWRMAEYVSWHRELDTLRNDMENRFDALVILHWNRTTFTRRAREICHQAGNKPCVTCHYEGFTNLRESLQTCLGQLLAAEQRA